MEILKNYIFACTRVHSSSLAAILATLFIGSATFAAFSTRPGIGAIPYTT